MTTSSTADCGWRRIQVRPDLLAVHRSRPGRYPFLLESVETGGDRVDECGFGIEEMLRWGAEIHRAALRHVVAVKDAGDLEEGAGPELERLVVPGEMSSRCIDTGRGEGNDRRVVTAVTVDTDETPGTVSVEKIPTLRPAFAKDGTVTAASSSSISDGAAAVVMMTATEAEKRGIEPIARIAGHSAFAQEPAWFTTAPV